MNSIELFETHEEFMESKVGMQMPYVAVCGGHIHYSGLVPSDGETVIDITDCDGSEPGASEGTNFPWNPGGNEDGKDYWP